MALARKERERLPDLKLRETGRLTVEDMRRIEQERGWVDEYNEEKRLMRGGGGIEKKSGRYGEARRILMEDVLSVTNASEQERELLINSFVLDDKEAIESAWSSYLELAGIEMARETLRIIARESRRIAEEVRRRGMRTDTWNNALQAIAPVAEWRLMKLE